MKDICDLRKNEIAVIRQQAYQVQETFKTRTLQLLVEKHLDQLVQRKSNGHIGKLSVEWDGHGNTDLVFHPLTKAGKVSLKSEYFYPHDLENEFIPYLDSPNTLNK